MTVCTNDVACGDLVENRLPVAVAEALGDAEALVAEAVELKDEWVGLAAVDAGTLTEESEQIGGAVLYGRPFALEGFRDVAIAVCRVVLLFVLGPAWPAVVVAPPAGFPAPGEVRYRLGLAATAADPLGPE